MNQSPMNKIRRIAVLRSLLLDFFLVLRLAIVFPPTAHSKKERPRPIASEEARQSPSRYNRPGRMNAVRLSHTCSIKTGGFFQRCNIIFPVKPGMSKSSHSKIAVYLHFWVLMAKQNSLVIYSFWARFSTSGRFFFGILTAGVPDFHCKIPLRRVY